MERARLAVLHVAGEFPPRRLGGIATYVDNVVQCASRDIVLGVLVVEGRDYHADPARGPVRAEIETIDLGRTITTLDSTHTLDVSSLRAHMTLPRSLARPWDVVHAHDWYGVVPSALLQARFGAKLVMTAHLPLRFGFTYANHPIPVQQKTRLEALGFRLADRVIAPSRYVARLLAREYDVATSKIRVIPNGVRLNEFRPSAHERSARMVLAASRLTNQKGLDHLIEIFRRVLQLVPEAHLVIAGDGPLKGDLERRAAALGIAANVELLGYVPHYDLAALYAKAAVFVSTSVYEPFGLTTLEAMASGCPVVVSPLGGAPDFVRDESDGFLRLPQRADEFAAAVGRILLDTLLRRRLSDNARRRAEEHSWERTTAEIEQEYVDLCGGSVSAARHAS